MQQISNNYNSPYQNKNTSVIIRATAMFDPKSTKYPYTEYTDQHYLVVKKNNGLVFDENYPYIDDSGKQKFIRWWTRVLLYILVFPLTIPYIGLKVKGRKNLKAYKNELKNGAITISNHIHLWDYISIMRALRPKKTRVIIWAPNVRGENGKMMRAVGGVPIPDDNVEGKAAFNKAIGKYLEDGGWLQIYAEGSMWEYYAPIRPFKTGAASLACRYDKPILPLGFSYRKPSWIRKHIFKQDAAITVTIGKPLFKDESLPEAEQRVDLTKRVHDAVCLLSGINPEDNIYPPIFDHNKRIDY